MIAKLAKIVEKFLLPVEDEITLEVKEAYETLGIKHKAKEVRKIREILWLYRGGKVSKAFDVASKSELPPYVLLKLAENAKDLDEKAFLTVVAGFAIAKGHAIVLKRDWFKDLESLAYGIASGAVSFTYDPGKPAGKRFTFITIPNSCFATKTIAEVANTI